jgi:hypothetical protein
MRFLGWIFFVLLLIFDIWFYRFQYRHLHNDIVSLRREIAMWEDLLEKEKNARETETRFSFDMEKFFASDADRLSPYGEIELARILNSVKGRRVVLLVYCNNLARYTASITKFISDQGLPLTDFRIEGKKQDKKQLVIISR